MNYFGLLICNKYRRVCLKKTQLLKKLKMGKSMDGILQSLRAFALTLNFYSPKAYNYVREVYRNKLSAPSTIRC